MVDRRGEDKTSFGIGLVLRDFCVFLLLGSFVLLWLAGVAKGENLVRNWLDFA
jgi:hypothetical protein